MKEVTRCECNNKNCGANTDSSTEKTFCMWQVNDTLISLANDKDYDMCPALREKILKGEYCKVSDKKWL